MATYAEYTCVTSDDVSYETWEMRLSNVISRITGFPLDCGEDVMSRDWYDDGMSVKDAVREVLDVWGFEH